MLPSGATVTVETWLSSPSVAFSYVAFAIVIVCVLNVITSFVVASIKLVSYVS